MAAFTHVCPHCNAEVTRVDVSSVGTIGNERIYSVACPACHKVLGMVIVDRP